MSSRPFKIRTDTRSIQKEDRVIDEDRQQICFCLALRGEGKSNLLEALAEKQFRHGYTILDLHAPPNFENAFWCIPKFKDTDENGNPDKKLFEKEIIDFKKDPVKFMKDRESYPVTILCSESFQWDQYALDRFNDRLYSSEEWYADHPTENFNLIYPPLKPKSKWGKEMIRFVRFPILKKNQDADGNVKVLEILTNIILDCRLNRRFLVLNRQAFGNENQYFWMMEMIMRALPEICEKHFIKKFQHSVGVETEKEMSKVDKKWHRMTVIHREMGELAPAKLKADKLGESTAVKKALLGFARVCRHSEIDWFGDWQKNKDVEDAIRNQCDTWLFKKYNKDLGGDEKKPFFDKIDWLRKRILLKGNNTRKAKMIADSWYPNVEELAKKYFYAKFLSGNIRLFKVPENRHQHKEPYMKFGDLTGIKMWHDKSKIPETISGTEGKVSKNDQMSLYQLMKSMRNSPDGKVMMWDDIGIKLGEMQAKGELSYSCQLKDKDGNWLSATFGKLKKKFEK